MKSMNKVKLVLVIVVVVLIVIIILQNRDSDTVKLLFVEVTMPRFAWLAGSLVIGVALGALAPWRWIATLTKKKK
jgi:uncharacterized integral membrane protein